ncbi:hypothetical protein [Tsukamurella tyrosinosolvens]|uniref:hypothetical protein n=1 Tax=Tsukamurella tyrosinosolvens TaxID=57704 RepID=UPI000DF71A8F|nr:hypothetical protein [Tsukamurella tyrosinosolvens]RDB48050.1 hypothetical protein DVB87_10005 [Tsukamurella tyrosinosolvens]
MTEYPHAALRLGAQQHQRKQTYGNGTVACRCGWVRKIRRKGDGIDQFIDHQATATAEALNERAERMESDLLAETMREVLVTKEWCYNSAVRRTDDAGEYIEEDPDPYFVGYQGPIDLRELADAIRAAITRELAS